MSLFAYGQTGTGKTHTLSGPGGLLPRMSEELIDFFDADKTAEYRCQVYYLEIYNERLRN